VSVLQEGMHSETVQPEEMMLMSSFTLVEGVTGSLGWLNNSIEGLANLDPRHQDLLGLLEGDSRRSGWRSGLRKSCCGVV
jgi:hypothetical protein